MKKLLFFFTLIFMEVTYASNFYESKLAENEKIVGTYSGSYKETSSFHLLLLKNSDSKKYILRPIIVSNDAKITSLKDYQSDKKFNIIASNSDENSINLFFLDEKLRRLLILKYNCLNGEYSEKTIDRYGNPEVIFNQKGKSYFVHYEPNYEKNKLYVDIFDQDLNIDKKVFELNEEIAGKAKNAFNNTVYAINQNEFVKHGSIQPAKAYLFENTIYVTRDKDDKTTNVISFDLTNKQTQYHKYDFGFDIKTKDFNSFVYGNKLFNVETKWNNFIVKYFDLPQNKEIKKQTLTDDLGSIFHQDSLVNFFEQDKKSFNKVTLTVNKNSDGNLLVTLSHVNRYSYSYHYDWWWFNHFMLMQMQTMQMMNTRVGGFGPNVNSDDESHLFMAPKKGITSLQFVIDDHCNLVKEAFQQPVYKEYDKEEYLREFEKNDNIKNFSAVFLNTEMRYIYFDNKLKVVKITSKK